MLSHVHQAYVIDDDVARIDWTRVHAWLTSSYWSPGITRARVERAARHSALVLGAYLGAEQVAYLRVISDKTRFAYFCDIWVEASHRRRGLARAMVRYAMEHPEFSSVTWLLATADAHGVYGPLGFAPLEQPQRWMACRPRNAAANTAVDSSV